jgi:hypothetical protein
LLSKRAMKNMGVKLELQSDTAEVFGVIIVCPSTGRGCQSQCERRKEMVLNVASTHKGHFATKTEEKEIKHKKKGTDRKV